ncbi:hypothetical protein SAMN06265375_1251 [Muriicola jejuensis]|uniref:Lipoprotein n=1 Tax=Muriicola jejuensis TaxID=504488 RepID=A0A6P0UFL0_9FLAO|nr:hypothetical protein [Muriicola jejuensis]NER11807.1 hypothetical protein [Muriicola jejuensis]SMP28474.1 hypothetical protein SAMN06265375_1251 [Muriicola jejuensis]
MKNTALVLILFFVSFISCDTQKKKGFEEYNEEDFIEVQGILTGSFRKTSFPNRFSSNIYFIYNLHQENPDTGYELDSPYMLDEGVPVIVLVHRDDNNISFFGGTGIIQEDVLLNYLDKCQQIGGGYYGVEDDFSKY